MRPSWSSLSCPVAAGLGAVLALDLRRQRYWVARALGNAGPLVTVSALATVLVTAALPAVIAIVSGALIGAARPPSGPALTPARPTTWS